MLSLVARAQGGVQVGPAVSWVLNTTAPSTGDCPNLMTPNTAILSHHTLPKGKQAEGIMREELKREDREAGFNTICKKTDLQRATFADGEVRAVAGTSARQVSVRTPDPGPSTAMDHLGTALACHQSKVGKRSLEAASTVGSWLGMLGVTAGAGASEVLLRTYKRKHDRVGT